MPTVLVVDSSVSLDRAVEHSTQWDLVLDGLLRFLDIVSQRHPSEEYGIVLFSADDMSVSPKASTAKEIEALLRAVQPGGKAVTSAAVRRALDAAKKFCDDRGNGTPCQVVCVLNATTATNNAVFECSVSCKLHALILCDNMSHQAHVSKRMCTLRRGHYSMCDITDRRMLMKRIDLLLQHHYPRYEGALVLGHLSATIRLHPDPSLTLSCTSGGTAARSAGLPGVPRVLSIVGFVGEPDFPNPPVTACYAVYTDEETSEGSLHVLLFRALQSTGTVAIVALCEDQRGMFYVGQQSKQGAALMFAVLAEDELPWVGGLVAHLVPTPPKEGSVAFPIIPNPTKSYVLGRAATFVMPFINEDAVTSDIGKLQRLAKGLPQKATTLKNEVARIQNGAHAYHYPSLVGTTRECLKQCLAASNKEGKKILEDILADM